MKFVSTIMLFIASFYLPSAVAFTLLAINAFVIFAITAAGKN